VLGAVGAWLAFSRLVDSIDNMQRLVAPGERDIVLDAGDYVVFGESESVVDGVAYANDQWSVRCSMTFEGAPLELRTVTGRTTYSFGNHAGRAIFEVTMPKSGTAHLACETEQGKAVIAVGTGIGASIVFGVLGLVFGVLLAGGVFTIIFIKRRKRT
jgi:hypothetical protein